MTAALALCALTWCWSAVVLADSTASTEDSALPAAPQIALDTPEATIDTLHEGLVMLATEHRVSNLAQRYEALRPLIVATHDLDFIAEFAIRRQWSDLSADQQQQFLAVFERLSVMTYASRFASVDADTFAPLLRPGGPGDGTPTRVQIASAIQRAEDDDIPMEYVLHDQAGEWRIINIVADGVSELALKRAEYQRVLGDTGIEGLIRHLQAQTDRLLEDWPD